jgi:hypothetical protein
MLFGLEMQIPRLGRNHGGLARDDASNEDKVI